MNKKFNLLLVLLFFLISLNCGFSSVEVFSNYDTTLNFIDDNKIEIQKSVTIRNIHKVGIVPGQIEFKIISDDNSIVLDEKSLKIVDKYNKEKQHKLIKTKEGYTIITEIFMPILPGFEYNLNLYYTLEYDKKGIFFNNLRLPLNDALDIPIWAGKYEINLPKNYKFTYISFDSNKTIKDQNKLIIDMKTENPEFLEIEYSYIPLNFTHFKGSYFFWIVINIILLFVLFLELRKEFIRRKSN